MIRHARTISPCSKSRLVCLLLLTLLLTGCATYSTLTNPHINRLKNRGPVLLSSDNPYVAANMLLQKLMEDSPEVKGFVEHRGSPSVLEVSEGLLSPPFVYFYYPDRTEYYTLENDKDFWVIQGPMKLSDIQSQQLASLTQGIYLPAAATPSAAPLPAEKKNTKEKKTSKTAEKSPGPEYVPLEATPREFSLKESKENKEKPADMESRPSPIGDLASGNEKKPAKDADEQIVRDILASEPSPKGEISPKGDLVHYVTQPDETLLLISRWYTYDSGNIGKIARVSGISAKQKLSPGDVIVIPSYMLRNKSRLSPKGLEALKESGR